MHRISTLLGQTAKLSALADQASNLAALQKLWSATVPEILRHSTHAGAIKHKRLTVYAENGAVAAKLKLLLPSLLTRLQKQGVEVTSIRIEVQVKSRLPKPKKPHRTLSSQSAEQLATLADKLGDSELAEALMRLASRS